MDENDYVKGIKEFKGMEFESFDEWLTEGRRRHALPPANIMIGFNELIDKLWSDFSKERKKGYNKRAKDGSKG